ncbi:uncharacterized protein FIBRA_08371 [Fibroporia radiculosa]|uniref:Fungal-type protein kinase domain-containing protein n=1 Tax=Fibroporia radiculosa TaxID=599839 RepID=J4I2M2_9APHY|nr:uncharacterized protein FIBRA_08371 [Fibroporia radiculosa]CCM06122.1 predicted protein [Fibroporia radiculosa]
MGDRSTPWKKKAITQHTDKKATRQKDEKNREAWSHEIQNKIHVVETSPNQFLRRFVPCELPVPKCPNPADGIFNLPSGVPEVRMYKPQCPNPADGIFNLPSGVPEVRMYKPQIDGLHKLVANFPDGKRPSFYNNSNTPIRFPFGKFDQEHHATKPDLIGGFKPQSLKQPRWRHLAIVLEAKPNAGEDPVGTPSEERTKTLIQLAKSARNLLVAHSRLFVFAVGLYGNIARIYRFDHAAAVVSQAFNYVENPEILHEFFWRFANPINPACGVVGDDPTISMPSHEDRALAKRLFEKHKGERFTGENNKVCRWITCKRPDGAIERYLTYRLVFMNPRLFSRATTVWEAFKEGDESGKTYVIKDAWRQGARRFEEEFYKDIREGVAEQHDLEELCDIAEEELELRGLAELEYAIDLGEEEMNAHTHEERNDPVSPAPSSFDSQPLSDDGFFGPPAYDTDQHGSVPSPPPPPYESDDEAPPPYESGHCTASAAILDRNMAKYNERSHTRLVMKTVGRPISEFESTREMVEALRDAIEGHGIAYKAGVLHKDVSEGNVLIAEDAPFKGFIGDFDYSFSWKRFLRERGWKDTVESWQHYTKNHEGIPDDENANAKVSKEQLKESELRNGLKERTGTFYFMAIEVLRGSAIHDARHDLESFYWLLVWLVLRHTDHDHVAGAMACSRLFDGENEWSCLGHKDIWLGDNQPVSVRGNAPLTHLLGKFNDCCYRSTPRKEVKQVPLTHELVLALFDEALAMDGWPEKDGARPFKMPNTPTTTVDVRPVSQVTGGRTTSKTTSTNNLSSVTGRPPRSRRGEYSFSTTGSGIQDGKPLSKRPVEKGGQRKPAGAASQSRNHSLSAIAQDSSAFPAQPMMANTNSRVSGPPSTWSSTSSNVHSPVSFRDLPTSGTKRTRATLDKENHSPSKRRKSANAKKYTVDDV